jgi:hypothetical protein
MSLLILFNQGSPYSNLGDIIGARGTAATWAGDLIGSSGIALEVIADYKTAWSAIYAATHDYTTAVGAEMRISGDITASFINSTGSRYHSSADVRGHWVLTHTRIFDYESAWVALLRVTGDADTVWGNPFRVRGDISGNFGNKPLTTFSDYTATAGTSSTSSVDVSATTASPFVGNFQRHPDFGDPAGISRQPHRAQFDLSTAHIRPLTFSADISSAQGAASLRLSADLLAAQGASLTSRADVSAISTASYLGRADLSAAHTNLSATFDYTATVTT